MAKKVKFDIKQFMLERGEKVGLVVAGVLMLLLAVPAVIAFMSAGNSTEKAKTLADGSQRVEFLLQERDITPANKPKPGDTDQPDPNRKTLALKSETVDPSKYQLAALVPEGG